nr:MULTISPECIES: branched-chain amino acid ABC transporter permease [unclassified Leptolyngbya]
MFDGLFNGISIGAVLLIAALGLAIVFGLMGVINLAHGELMMLGAYTTYVVQNVFKPLGEPFFSLYIFAAVIAAFIVAALAGLALERGVIRYLYGRPLETLLATWGVSLILRQFVRSVSTSMAVSLTLFCVLFFGAMWVLSKRLDWEQVQRKVISILLPLSLAIAFITGSLLNTQAKLAKPWFSARNVDVTPPAWLRGGVPVGTMQLPYTRLFIIALTLLCLFAIYWFLQKSAWGLRIRSVTQNRNMSACLGIPTQKVDALTFALGSGLAGVAGCAVSLLGSVGPNLGANYIVDAFMVVVVGGVGKIVGSVVAALVIGTLNYLVGSGTITLLVGSAQAPVLQPLVDFFTFFATTSMAKVMVFILIIAFLQVRPAGLFPPKGRAAEI